MQLNLTAFLIIESTAPSTLSKTSPNLIEHLATEQRVVGPRVQCVSRASFLKCSVVLWETIFSRWSSSCSWNAQPSCVSEVCRILLRPRYRSASLAPGQVFLLLVKSVSAALNQMVSLVLIFAILGFSSASTLEGLKDESPPLYINVIERLQHFHRIYPSEFFIDGGFLAARNTRPKIGIGRPTTSYPFDYNMMIIV